MRNVLLPLDDGDSIVSPLVVAALLRQRFGSYIDGVAIGPDMPEARVVDLAWSSSSFFDPARRREVASRIRERFERFMTSHPDPMHLQPRDQPSFGFVGDNLLEDTELGILARLYDMTVLPRLDVANDVPRMATLLSVILKSGRPTMISSPKPPLSLGKNILIIWNESIETARALGFANPFLDKADRVYMVSSTRHQTSRASPRELAARLRNCGINVSLVPLDGDPDPSGERILAVAHQLDADLLIRGAYTRGPLRQAFFGGVTRYLLEHSGISMLLAH
jgi:nucleotide-binding universal stress UspA family protein